MGADVTAQAWQRAENASPHAAKRHDEMKLGESVADGQEDQTRQKRCQFA
jgi:hypothetical protein